MKKILTDAVAVGNATARAISFRDRDARTARIYKDSHWQSPSSSAAITSGYNDGGIGGRNMDARTNSSTSPRSTRLRWSRRFAGRGSQYAVRFR